MLPGNLATIDLLAIREGQQMKKETDIPGRGTILLTDVALDAVVGGMRDFAFVKQVDKASAKLHTACATGEHLKTA
jgi:type VI protein secretion system component Hcp